MATLPAPPAAASPASALAESIRSSKRLRPSDAASRPYLVQQQNHIQHQQQQQPSSDARRVVIPVTAAPPAAAAHDEEGNLEDLLRGGWQNRLVLALRSGLPNEVDWAFNRLVKLTFHSNFYIGRIPCLPEALIEHMRPFFDQLTLKTSPLDFETSIFNGADCPPLLQESPSAHPTPRILSLSGAPLVVTPDAAVLLEHVHQALHIIRGLALLPENALAFSKDWDLLMLLAKAVALPACTAYVEIKQYALDIYESLAAFLVLRGQADFFLACIKQMLFESDRARVAGSVRALIRLAANEANERTILAIDTYVIQRLIQLLLVRDEDIVVSVMEFFYLFTSMSPDAGIRITTSVRFNVLRLLLKFLYWRGHSNDHAVVKLPAAISAAPTISVPAPISESTSSIAPLPATSATSATALTPNATSAGGATPGIQHLATPSQPRPPPDLDPRARSHFFAAIWIQDVSRPDPNHAIWIQNFYAEYLQHCTTTNTKPIPTTELIKLIEKVFPSHSFSIISNAIKGLGPRPNTTAAFNPRFANALSGQSRPPVAQPSVVTNAATSAVTPTAGTPASATAVGMASTHGAPAQPSSASASTGPQPMQIDSGDNQGTSSDLTSLDQSTLPLPSGESQAVRDPQQQQEQFTGDDVMQEDIADDQKAGALPVQTHHCRWLRGGCTFAAESPEKLLSHILDVHLAESLAGKQRIGAGTSPKHVCEWLSCTRFSATKPAGSRAKLVSHICTHLAFTPAKLPTVQTTSLASMTADPIAPATHQQLVPTATHMPHLFPEPHDELRGIPLCALLVLRNIARHPDNHTFFWPLEAELTQLMIQPRITKLVGSVLAELKPT